MMTENDEQSGVEFDRLSESFIASWRNGQFPGIEEYANEHPAHADEIRELFPALILAEQLNVKSQLPRGGYRTQFASNAWRLYVAS